MPRDFKEPGEWAFGRLMYPPVGRIYGGFEMAGSWTEGASNWAMDYPRSDRHLSAGRAAADAASTRAARSK